MSRQLINAYRAELDRLRVISGRRRESVLREAFKDLLKQWGRAQELQFVAEHDLLTKRMTRIYVDGALLHSLRVPFGYWEAKDEDDDLSVEIEHKFRKGYPKDNIVFTDDVTAVLWQDGSETMRAAMQADDDTLLQLLTCFFSHQRKEIADFNKAVKQFATDLPNILKALRDRISEKQSSSSDFAMSLTAFLHHARETINASVTADDVREMLIQHVLTEDIFAKVFDDPDFHRKNNIAAELYKLEDKLFGRGQKASLLRALGPYYSGISSTAALIESHSEKQGFLKALYEDFYKAYNRKAADRLGVIYTPSEIVRFMIRATDNLCEGHFQRGLIDRGVEILDPSAGTGTFIVELIEYFRGNRQKLQSKYREELHANEVAILPYYVANLNIEATYQAITGEFQEYPNLCLVDTLDNIAGLGIYSGHQFDLLGSLSDENIERIIRQNRRKISVVIGNPPYNANQQNENDNNKNRAYAHVDKRIKETYVKSSIAQKTKLYDMYTRFYRWASDRLGSEGILALITNRSFIDAFGFDGFRRTVAQDFSEGWIVDLGGDYKRKGAGGSGNVFGIGTGVAIGFWVRREDNRPFQLNYMSAPSGTGDEKLSWLGGVEISKGLWQKIALRRDAAWVDVAPDANEGLIPLADRAAKRADNPRLQKAIFRDFSLGISTNRDDWLIDRDKKNLGRKARALISGYAATNPPPWPNTIKWSETLKKRREAGQREPFSAKRIEEIEYRPFTTRLLYRSPLFIDRPGLADTLFPPDADNLAITCAWGRRGSFSCLATAKPSSLDWYIPDANQYYARYRYNELGERVDNIPDWALNKFVTHYGKKAKVTKDAIFSYVYGVLHDPLYRVTYQLHLKRDFPGIPFYANFERWAKWGAELLAMHAHYEDVEPWALQRKDAVWNDESSSPRPVLRSVPAEGLIRVDEITTLKRIPSKAWDYQLGNRAAIEWVLDQHKERAPRDPVVCEKYNTYRFADHKEAMISLIGRVVRISLKTVDVCEEMRSISRAADGNRMH